MELFNVQCLNKKEIYKVSKAGSLSFSGKETGYMPYRVDKIKLLLITKPAIRYSKRPQSPPSLFFPNHET
jgi:hypothetical protein